MALDLFLIGLVITLYPLPILAFVLVVSAPRGVWKGLVFILAWLGCLVLVIAIVLLLTNGEPPPPRSPPSTAVLAIKLVLGVGLIVYSERKRRRRKSAAVAADGGAVQAKPEAPKSAITSRTDQATFWSAATLAVLLQPWGMVGLAASTVVEADLSHTESYLALMGFCLLASATLLAMELYMVFAPERAHQALTNLREWLNAHKEPAIVVSCLLLGLWIVGRSLYQLTS
ncbi:GAP family protein [Streptomyces sp. NPDC059835]|uniref:GAP family protein n=1 Tax=Streptomyces sp. NPDC059835 TaxID=3346967 RepID=UPI00364FADA8